MMGTEFIRTCLDKEDIDIPEVPPGFESFCSLYLKKVEDDNDTISSSASTTIQMEPEYDINYSAKVSRYLRRKPEINYSQFDNYSDDESYTNRPSMPCLPKGVVRGSSVCNNCQKVTARWRPNNACRPDIEKAPVFYPKEEDFNDTLKYIASIRPMAEKYGICRIVPPHSWKPPCPLKEKQIWECSKFSTRVQRIDKLQNRDSMRKLLDMRHAKKKTRRCSRLGVDHGDIVLNEVETFGFETGPDLTLNEFEKYADDFKSQYFSTNKSDADLGTNVTVLQGRLDLSVENIEGEYWRIVEKPSEQIEVLYGADLETGAFGSGFPTISSEVNMGSDDQYIKSGWNLNNIPRLPGSVLSYESGDISGVLVPWLYIGMCFSSFCWHVEDHHLYSLNYMHWGAPKMWYGVPETDALKFEAAMRKHLPDLFKEQPDLLHKLVTQLSPSILKSEGVPVYRCVQYPGEFVLTFPRAYHAGFNCGFNCAEAVNVAPIDWLPHGQNAVELYRQQGRKTSISHDKLLLGAAREVVRANWELDLLKRNTSDNLRWKNLCGKDGILAKSLKGRVEMECVWRQYLCNSPSQTKKMNSNFDATSERECFVCHFDLHLSATGCSCSPEKFACLNHAHQLCLCSGNSKIFLFRYDITELNILMEAMEGKLSAIYRWARLDLGLALSSYLSRDGKLIQNTTNMGNKVTSQSLIISIEDLKDNDIPAVEISSQLKAYEVEKPVGRRFGNVICLSDDEELSSPISDLVKRSLHADILKPILTIPMTNATIISQKGDVISLSNQKNNVGSCHVGSCEAVLNKEIDLSNNVSKIGELQEGNNKDNVGSLFSQKNIVGSCHVGSCDSVLNKKVDLSNNVSTIEEFQEENNKDNCFRQKGPRIAKVVKRINSIVEPLEFGTIQPGKLWCNDLAIFPKGYKSRVRYISSLDPTIMCYYVSEILDAGKDGPLFMVFQENFPSEVFIQVSAVKCWEMVRERLNQMITKQHKLGKVNLPPLQPPGSLDGIEMFGFTSPHIIKAIELRDANHVCIEYWKFRPELLSVQKSQSDDSCKNRPEWTGNNLPTSVTASLFKKASLEELHSLYSVLSDTSRVADQTTLTRLLSVEIQSRPR